MTSTLDVTNLEDARLHPLWPAFVRRSEHEIIISDWMRFMHQHFDLFVEGAATQNEQSETLYQLQRCWDHAVTPWSTVDSEAELYEAVKRFKLAHPMAKYRLVRIETTELP